MTKPRMLGPADQASDKATPVSNWDWRWGLATVLLMLIAYPAGRWMRGSDAASVSTAQVALHNSLEHYRAGRYQDAVYAAQAAIAADSNLADAYNNLAVSYLQLRQYDEALRAVQEAIRLKPDFELAKNNLAWIQQQKAKAVGSAAK